MRYYVISILVLLSGFGIYLLQGHNTSPVINLEKLTDYPSQIVHDNNWLNPENFDWSAKNLSFKPTKILARGTSIFPLPYGEKIDLDRLEFSAPDAAPMSMSAAMKEAKVNGYIVLKDGEIIYEKYFDNFSEHQHHSWFSGSKSLIGIAVGILAEQGKIDVNKTPADYIKPLKNSAFAKSSIQHCLDMTSALAYTFEEGAMEPGHFQYEYFLRANIISGSHLATGNKDVKAPRGIRAIATLTQSQESINPGDEFYYQNLNVDIIGWLIEEVSGLPLEEFLRNEVWAKLQTEHDAMMIADPNFTAQASGGLMSTLRDHARFGQAIVSGGKLGDEQVFPKEWIDSTFKYSSDDERAFRANAEGSMKNYTHMGATAAYKNYWYIFGGDQEAMTSRGFGGQSVYVNRTKGVVIATFSSATTEDAFARNRLVYFNHLLASKLVDF